MKRIYLLLGIILFTTGVFAANKKEYNGTAEKTFNEEFKVDKDALLKVSNQFGSIDITNWNESKVSIQVDISVETSSEEKAKRTLQGISVSFNGDKSLVEAYTKMEKNLCNNGCDIKIDYTIKMPATMKIDLLQKFGDIHLEERKGEAKIGVKYGGIVAQRLNAPDNEVFVKFGDAEIEYIKSGRVEVDYSKFSLDEAQSLEITSSYSELTIDRINDLQINSSYDEIEIDHVASLEIESGFTETEVDYLGKDLIATLKYGGLEIGDVDDDFTRIKIDTEFADVELGLSSSASYQLDAETKFGDVEFPDDSRITIEKKSFTENKYKGSVGSNDEPTANISIYAKHANVELN